MCLFYIVFFERSIFFGVYLSLCTPTECRFPYLQTNARTDARSKQGSLTARHA